MFIVSKLFIKKVTLTNMIFKQQKAGTLVRPIITIY